MYALDTETYLIVPGILAPRMVCVSWAHGEERGVLHRDDPRALALIRYVLDHEHSTYANAPFDLGVFASTFPELVPNIFNALDDGRIHDVQTRAKLDDIAQGWYRKEVDEEGNVKRIDYSLAQIVRRLTNGKVKLDKDTWRLKYHRLSDTPLEEWPEGALKYAADDAEVTLRVHRRQEADIDPEVLVSEPHHVRAHVALHLMSCWGIRTDPDKVFALRAETTRQMSEAADVLVTEGLLSVAGQRQTKVAKARMVAAMERLGEPVSLTPTGESFVADAKPKPREEAVEEAIKRGYIALDEDACVQSGDPVLKEYARFSKLQNLLKKDIRFLERGTVLPIQSRFEPLMETGRTSSSSPNIQNLRRGVDGMELGVRECFVPREGMVLLACDYGAAELHSLAQVCVSALGKSKLADALNAGRDPHLDMGANILGIPYGIALELKEKRLERWDREDGETFFHKVVKDARQMAKAANFGFPGGMSARRFYGYAQSYGLSLEVQQCVDLRRRWADQWTEMVEYFDWIRRHERNNRYYMTHPVTGFRRGRMSYTAACNFPFQHLTAHGAKAALWEVTRRQFDVPGSALYGTATVNFVHDELILEVPETRIPECAAELEKVMCDEYNRTCPDVPVRAEATAMRYWSKKFDAPTFDERGRMVAWS